MPAIAVMRGPDLAHELARELAARGEPTCGEVQLLRGGLVLLRASAELLRELSERGEIDSLSAQDVDLS